MATPTCTARTSQGTTCKLTAMIGTDRCRLHTPMDIVRERTAAGAVLRQHGEVVPLDRSSYNTERHDYALLTRELVGRNVIILRGIWAILEEVQALGSAEALLEHGHVLSRWESTTKSIWSLIQTAAILDPASPDEDQVALGIAGVERLMEAIESVTIQGEPCECCGGTGRVAPSSVSG